MRALNPDSTPLWDTPGTLRGYQDYYQSEGGAAFGAIFMQDPSALAGDVFNPEWFKHWCSADFISKDKTMDATKLLQLGLVDKILPADTALTRGMGIDLAISKKDTADYYARVAGWASVEGDLFIDSVRRGRLSPLKIIEEVMEFAGYSAKHPKARIVAINQDQMQMVLLEVLPLIPGAGKLPWVPVEHKSQDKTLRARPLAARYEGGRVFHRYGAPWLEGFEAELASFPGGPFDDQVDAAVGLWEKINVYIPTDWKRIKKLNEEMRQPQTLEVPTRWTDRI